MRRGHKEEFLQQTSEVYDEAFLITLCGINDKL
jgi:hypothetical protein